MTRLVAIFAIIGILLVMLAPSASAGSGLRIGDKVVLDNGVVTEYLGKNVDGTLRWKATIGAPLYLDDLTTPIDCRWSYDEIKKEWHSTPNLYDTVVKDTKVTITYDGLKLSWQPDVLIGTKKQAPILTSGLPYFTDPINENYGANTLYWNYGPIERNLRIIEGMLIEYYIIDSLPTDDILIIPHTTKDLGFVWTRPSEAWDDDHNLLELVVGKNGELTLTLEAMEDAVFPVTIDPDTSFISTSSDGYMYAPYFYTGYGTTAAAWNAAHDPSTAYLKSTSVLQVGIRSLYESFLDEYYAEVDRAYVYFSTDGLPDACEVDSATLRLYVAYEYTQLGSFDVIIQGGMPTYPHDPPVLSDFLYTYYSGDYGQLHTDDITTGHYEDWTLTATGKAAIDKTGTTKFVLREEQHDEDDIAPSFYTDSEKYSRVICYPYEQGDGYWPILEVTYSASAAPTITTDAASDIANTTARLNSTVVDDGGGDVEVRWGYGETTQTEANFLLYDTVTEWEGEYNSGEHPYYDATSLTHTTHYFFRVQAREVPYGDEGVTTGGQVEFDTTSDISDPTDFRGYPQATSISLSWTKGSGSTQSLIRFRYDTYPTTETDGTQVYLGTSASYTHNGLTPGTTYYYSVWGESGGGYSSGYDSIMVTTKAAEAEGEALPTPPEPTGWMQSPNPDALENLEPFFTIANNLFESFEVPKGTGWLMLSLMFCVGLGVMTFMVSKHLLAGIMVLVVAMVVSSFQELIPFWMIFIVILIGVGVMILKGRATS